MKSKKKKTHVRKVINKKKIFCFVSFIFLMICCLWYGGRAIYFYLDSRKSIKNEAKTLAQTVLNDDSNIKKINDNSYFYKKAKNNYVVYSNLVWRIVKVSNKNNATLILDDAISDLAYGKGKKYSNSYIMKWLNNKDTFLDKLNDKSKYLTKSTTCVDNIKSMKNISCNKTMDDNYLSLLSVVDYINTGGSQSFINDGKNSYLINNDNKGNVWYINEDGKLDNSNGEDIYGVRPVITLKDSVSIVSGNGSKSSPYTIEDKNELFASYVKLDNDIWRVYDVDDDYVKLSLNDYVKFQDEALEYNYSKKNYVFNDTEYGSLAYYLNHKFLNSLSYSSLIAENTYNNGVYGEDNKFNYTNILDNTITTKVYMLSVGDAFVNNNLENYFVATGTSDEEAYVYVANKNNTLEDASVSDEKYVVPCISIKRANLKYGSGTVNDPYRTE